MYMSVSSTTTTTIPSDNISSLLTLEKNILNTINNSNDKTLTSDQTKNIQDSINSINTILTNYPDVGASIYTKQNEMNQIVQDETAHLDKREQNIQTAISGQKRMIDLNNNYIARTREYMKIAAAFGVALLAYILLYVLNRYVEIPRAIYLLLIVVIFSIFAIYAVKIWITLQTRDPTNFNRVNLPPTIKSTTLGTTSTTANLQQNAKIGDILGSDDLNNCQGSACCSESTKWSSTKQLCVDKNTKDPFTSRSFAPSEFDSYSVYQ